jgi:hypothetical protein
MSNQQSIQEAREALSSLEMSLQELDSALPRPRRNSDDDDELDSAGDWSLGDDDDLDSTGEWVALSLDRMASALCGIDALALPEDMRREAPALDEVLAYLASDGKLENKEAAALAAGIIEYVNHVEYGAYPRNSEDYPAIADFERLTGAIDELLTGLEEEH